MGYVIVLGDCYVCHLLFSFSPTRVPSAVVNGVREPICEACVERANTERARRGLDLIAVLPGAYEPADESELPL